MTLMPVTRISVAVDCEAKSGAAPWIERVGLDHVKAGLFDDPDAVRKLAGRFRYSQQFMQDDPWAERAAGKDAELHQHLAEVRPFPTDVTRMEFAK